MKAPPPPMLDLPESLKRCAAEIEGWLDLGCPEKALEKLGPLLADPGAKLAGLYLRARALVELGRNEEALADIAEIRPFDPDPDWLDLAEAWCLKRTGDLQGAAACMERLIARSHRSAIGHFNLGCYLALLGQRERAIEEVTLACGLEDQYRRAAATEPDLESLRGDPRFEELIP